MRKTRTLICIILFCALAVTGCKKEEEKKTVHLEPDKTTTETQEDVKQEETVDSHQGQKKSYLTGKWINEKIADRRPLAIMMGNTSEACPQSGIGRADVLYEVPVEGAITRIMAIFQNYSGLERIGSVRSCRYYFIYYAMEFDAVYAHYGQSKYAKPMLAQENVDNLNGLEGIGNTVFYRSHDAKAPHNAFAKASGIKKAIKIKKFRKNHDSDYKGHFLFGEEDKEITLEEYQNAKDAAYVAPGYSIDAPWYEYNEKDGLYYRFAYGKPHKDAQTSKQLTAKNIILQYSAIGYMDDHMSLKIDTRSGGKGLFVTAGKAIPITWSKDSEYGVTHYFDQQGVEITLNPGKTWILIVDKDHLDKVKISATIE
ncbi:MAG: DUF3048 domain-containing protein [Lachnospiraceae bacterium]